VLYEEKTYSNSYKFNGKEFDTETGLSYYGARYYAPELSIWYGVDPLMEKYPQNGAYVFCNANPIKFVDLDGRKFTDWSKKYIDKFKEVIENKLSSLNNQLKELNPNKKSYARKTESIQNQINEVNEASKELNALEESDQLYSIQIGIPKIFKKEGTNLYGSTFYNIGTDAVTVGIDVSLDINSDEFMGVLAHELKHCFQFEIGELSYNKFGTGGTLYDFEDEVSAHYRGFIFGAHTSYPDNKYDNLNRTSLNILNYSYPLNNDYHKKEKITYKPNVVNK